MFQYLNWEMEQDSEQNPTAEKVASSAMSDRQDTRTWNSKKKKPHQKKNPDRSRKEQNSSRQYELMQNNNILISLNLNTIYIWEIN